MAHTHTSPKAPALSEYVGQLERLQTVHELKGFYPTTRSELDDAFGLLSFSTVRPGWGGAANYLQEVMLHQQQRTRARVPERATTQIVNEFAGYARDARRSLGHLNDLERRLKGVMNPRLTLEVLFGGRTPGATEAIRFLGMQALAQRLPEDDAIFPADPALEPKPSMRPQDFARTTDVGAMRGMLPAMLGEQTDRHGFWEQRLEEAAEFPPARDVAAAALQGVGLRESEVPGV